MNLLGSTTGSIVQDLRLAIYKRVKETGFNYSAYPKENIQHCDLCSDNQFKLYAHQDRYGLPIRSMQCLSCGLIFLNPRMKQQAYTEFYVKWYRKLITAFDGKEPTKEWFETQRNKQAEVVLKFLGKHLDSSFEMETMLDIGGSIGVFAEKVCKITGAKGTVIDPCIAEIKEASKRGLQVSTIPFEDFNSKKKFDLISMLKTVEHLSSVDEGLKKVRQLLAPNGVFLIDIVNHDWLAQMIKNNNLCTKIDHVYQLTDKTIRQYFHKHRFEVIGNSDVDQRYIYYLVK